MQIAEGYRDRAARARSGNPIIVCPYRQSGLRLVDCPLVTKNQLNLGADMFAASMPNVTLRAFLIQAQSNS